MFAQGRNPVWVMTMRNKHRYKPLLTCLVLAAALAPMSVGAAIKCWTNSEGVRECGNTVPPEYAQQGHEEKSTGGITVGKQKQARTIEEIEADRAAEREAELDEAAAQQQAAKDRVLLDTFSSEDDMVLARDGQISHLESQIRLTEGRIEKLKGNLDQVIQTAADQERRGQAPGEKLTEDIESLRNQIKENRAFIDDKRMAQDEIRAQFDADIARFRTLKSSR